MQSRCVVCDGFHALGGAPNTPEGRSRLTIRKMVPDVHFGRNGRTRWQRGHEPIDPTFTEDDPWDADGHGVLMCKECRDELLGQPVLLSWDLALLSSLIRQAGLTEERRTTDRSKMASRVELFHDVIARGLEVLMKERNCPLDPSEGMRDYPHTSFWPPSGPFREWERRRIASANEPERDKSA